VYRKAEAQRIPYHMIEQLIRKHTRLTSLDAFDGVLNYIVSVIQSSLEDKLDAQETLADLLSGVCDSSSQIAADIIQEYHTIMSQTAQQQEPAKLAQPIQISPTTPNSTNSSDSTIQPKKKRLTIKQRIRLRQEQEAAILEETNTWNPTEMNDHDVKFPGFRRAKPGGQKNIVLYNPSITVGGMTILGDEKGYDEVEYQYVFAHGTKYGLVGENGSGKSTLLRFLSSRELSGIPDTLSIYHVEQEIERNDESVLMNVLQADLELVELLQEEEELYVSDPESPRLLQIYNRLLELDYDTAVTRAATILAGLSFTEEMQQMPTRLFSGGWLMRIALAKALYCNPDVLLLDEPTNHLDFHALIWLENFLKNWPGTIIIVSHQVKFLNAICDNIVVLSNCMLNYYQGQYSSTVLHSARWATPDVVKMQEQLRKEYLQEFESFARQFPESKQRMERLSGWTSKAPGNSFSQVNFHFGKQSVANHDRNLNMFNVSFSYPPRHTSDKRVEVLKNISHAFSQSSRIAIVGRNGCGKTTLLKLLVGELSPDQGEIERSPRLKLTMFTQDFVDQLTLNQTPLEYLFTQFGQVRYDQIEKHLARFGLVKPHINHKIAILSGGQKSRLVFAKIALEQPDLLLLDEPSNHLDIEASLNLARGLSLYEGSVLLVSHDERLINSVCDTIMYLEDGQLLPWHGDIDSYKAFVLEQIEEENKERKKRKHDLKQMMRDSLRNSLSSTLS